MRLSRERSTAPHRNSNSVNVCIKRRPSSGSGGTRATSVASAIASSPTAVQPLQQHSTAPPPAPTAVRIDDPAVASFSVAVAPAAKVVKVSPSAGEVLITLE